MKKLTSMFVIAAIVLSTGCAHPIVITPNLGNIDRKDSVQSDKNAGYYISADDRFREVTTPGGGGDKIRYTPYKDLEPALQKVLANTFRNVHTMPAERDMNFITANNIAFSLTSRVLSNPKSSISLFNSSNSLELTVILFDCPL